MITLSGCAKRNADRELARVVGLLDGYIRAHAQTVDGASTAEMAERVGLATWVPVVEAGTRGIPTSCATTGRYCTYTLPNVTSNTLCGAVRSAGQ